MNATAHLPNRMAGYFRDEDSESESADDREAFWLETLHLAMVELRAELKSENPKVRSKAAHKIIDLERTKLRHAKRFSLESRLQPVFDSPTKAEDRLKPGLQRKPEDGLKPELQRNQEIAGRLKAELQRNQEHNAEIEAEAMEALTEDLQGMTAMLANKLELKDRSMTTPETARKVIAEFMRANNVTIMKIDPLQIGRVVMDWMVRIKEREEAADANRNVEAEAGAGDPYPTIGKDEDREVQPCPRM